MQQTGRISLALLLVATITAVALGVSSDQPAQAASLSQGDITMVSANAGRTDSAPPPVAQGNFGSDQVAISEDGKVVAFVSTVPAPLLVNDPLQVGNVTDTNDVEDVFVWDSRVPAPIGPITTLVSWNATHTGTGGGVNVVNPRSFRPIMAPGGLGIVFESRAKDLTTEAVTSDANLYAWLPLISDVFPLFLVNENTSGVGSDSINADPSIAVSLVPPAARVAFTSNATDMVSQPNSGAEQVYVRSWTPLDPGGTTEMVSLNAAGDAGTVNGADDPMISGSAGNVVFASGGTDIVTGANPLGGANIWNRNLLTDTTTLVSAAAGVGTSGNNSPAVSADGQSVVWSSNDLALSPTPHNGNAHIFQRTGAGLVQMMDTHFSGAIGCNSASNNPGISQSGLVVVWETFCTDSSALPDGNAGGTDVFVRTVPAGLPVLVSVNETGTASGNGASFICPGVAPPFCGASSNPGIVLSAAGDVVTFFSSANDIAPPANSPPPFSNGNVFVRYPLSDTTVNVTQTAGATNPNGTSRDAVISADGSTVAFTSLADDLVTPDTNVASDAFVADLRNTVTIESEVVNEGDGTVTLTVTRSGNLATEDAVDYETVDGVIPELPLLPNFDDGFEAVGAPDANGPGDFVTETGTITFAPGDTSETIVIDLIDDATQEGPESFRVSLDPGPTAKTGDFPQNQAYVGILDDDQPAQDWSVAFTGQPAASTQAGDTVSFTATVSVDAGADSLDLGTVTNGASTAGFADVQFDAPSSDIVAAGGTATITGTATLTGTPGSNANVIEIVVAGELGAGSSEDRTDTTDATTSLEAVTATLATTAGATVTHADQITYTLELTNGSDTAATLSGLPAGLAPPTGTALVSNVDGSTSLAADSATTYTLTVSVDDDLPSGALISQQPSGVQYAMPSISLAARDVPITPTKRDTTVAAAAVSVTAHSITDADAGDLEVGDAVEVSITVTNAGLASATSVSLEDTLNDLTTPTDVEIDAVDCGACPTTASSVTAALGTLAPSSSTTVTFDALVASPPVDATASSSAVVTFTGGPTGASPTVADVESATIHIPGAPVGVDDDYNATEDQLLTVLVADGVLDNDSDPDGDPFTATALDESATAGDVTLAADGSFTFDPDADFSGDTSFTYVPADAGLSGNVTTVVIHVAGANDAPVGTDDAYGATEDQLLTVLVADGVLDNDTDADADGLTATDLDETNANGDVTLAADGSFTYQPTAGFTGPASFTYVPNDGTVDGNVTTVTLTVSADAPDAPVADADAYATDEDTDLTVLAGNGVLVGDTDADGDPLAAVQLVEGPDTHGDVTLNPDGSFVFDPDDDFNGVATFTYRASDGSLTSPATTVTITVNPVNDAPVGNPDVAAIVSDGGSVVIQVLTNDVDVDGDTLTVEVVTQPLHGDVICTPTGTCTYSPDAGYVGPDSFEYVIHDDIAIGGSAGGEVAPAAVSDPIKVDITVTPKQNPSTSSTTSSTVGVGGGGQGTGATGGAGGAGGAAIPRTGTDSSPLALMGLGFVLFGVGVVQAAGRRRRQR